jgi:chromosome segregation ATPase
MDELKKAYEIVKANFEGGITNLNAMVTRIDAKCKEIDNRESEIASLIGEVARLKRLLEQVEKQRDEMRQGMTNAQNDLADGVRRAAAQREELELSLKARHSAIVEQNDALRRTNAALSMENERLGKLYEECKDHPTVVAYRLSQVEVAKAAHEAEQAKKKKEFEEKIAALKAKLPTETEPKPVEQ